MDAWCVLQTADAEATATWAGCTHAHIRRWADSIGMQFLTAPFENDTWSIPRAMHWVLTERTHCKRTLYLDSDVHVDPRWDPRTDARVDANASFQVVRFAHPPPSVKSTINTGAFFFQADGHARGLAHWWRSRALGACPANVPTPEQFCFQRAPQLNYVYAHAGSLRVDFSNASAGVASWHHAIDVFKHATDLSSIRADMDACRASAVPVCHAPAIRFLCKPLANRLGARLQNCSRVVHRALFCAA
jgi:hypothetical protein